VQSAAPVSEDRCKASKSIIRTGSGVVGRRPFEYAALGDRGRIRDPSRIRPSGNAALGETTTSTAPHLFVRSGRDASGDPFARRLDRPMAHAQCALDHESAACRRPDRRPVEWVPHDDRWRATSAADRRMQWRRPVPLSILRNRPPMIRLGPDLGTKSDIRDGGPDPNEHHRLDHSRRHRRLPGRLPRQG
jgi:hypothetical protein